MKPHFILSPSLMNTLMYTMRATIEYTIAGYGIDPSNDMGYVYGNISTGDKKEITCVCGWPVIPVGNCF